MTAQHDETKELPEFMGQTDAAAFLGIPWPSNLYGLKGLPEPALWPRRGRLWRTADLQRFKEEREAGVYRVVRPLKDCDTHGAEFMHKNPSGKRYCKQCNRERAAAAKMAARTAQATGGEKAA